MATWRWVLTSFPDTGARVCVRRCLGIIAMRKEETEAALRQVLVDVCVGIKRQFIDEQKVSHFSA